MTPAQVIVLAAPVFFLLIGIEYAVGRRRGRNTYRLNDTLNSLSLGFISQIVAVFSVALMFGIYTLVYTHLSLWQLSPGQPWVWVAGLVLYDFCYYWLHRAGHSVALFWAAHAVHHQSEDYNLGTALRQTGSNWVAGWVFYLPMAVLGFPPLVFGIVGLIDLLYQYWVHTQHIGKLGAFDRWFCAPSNHRVHHAVNDKYLDRNYGGILIAWDRLFGTFQEEDDAEPCVYGTRSPLRSWNPVWANLQVYADLARDSVHARRWGDKLRVWFKPPGWRPADVAERFPKPAFDMHALQRYDPPMSARAMWVAGGLFVLLDGAVALWLWHAHRLGVWEQVGSALAIVAGLCVIGWLCERHAGARP